MSVSVNLRLVGDDPEKQKPVAIEPGINLKALKDKIAKEFHVIDPSG